MDIALDTVPYNGGTTTCDALWMGVPVITLPGGRFCSRMGASILKTVGLDEFVAADADDYVRLATTLAFDRPELRTLRSSLRNQIQNSLLCNSEKFTHDFEQTIQTMIDPNAVKSSPMD
jgi:predicted O-linked N-acetylglucosamine transferase (SPINDLY family)